jgi:hypothetical protein
VAFAGARHVMRHEILAGTLPDPLRVAVGLPVGLDGGYFVGSRGRAWDESVKNPHIPPTDQPSCACAWLPTRNGAGLRQAAGAAAQPVQVQLDWLRYLVEHFLRPWGYTLHGELAAQDATGNRGRLVVNDTQIGLFWHRAGHAPASPALPSGTPARAALPLLAEQGAPAPELPQRRILRRSD